MSAWRPGTHVTRQGCDGFTPGRWMRELAIWDRANGDIRQRCIDSDCPCGHAGDADVTEQLTGV